jgi:hypothetical protein
MAVGIALLVLKLRRSNGIKDGPSDERKPCTDVTQHEEDQRHIHPYELYTEHEYGELGQPEPQELEARSGNVH